VVVTAASVKFEDAMKRLLVEILFFLFEKADAVADVVTTADDDDDDDEVNVVAVDVVVVNEREIVLLLINDLVDNNLLNII